MTEPGDIEQALVAFVRAVFCALDGEGMRVPTEAAALDLLDALDLTCGSGPWREDAERVAAALEAHTAVPHVVPAEASLAIDIGPGHIMPLHGAQEEREAVLRWIAQERDTNDHPIFVDLEKAIRCGDHLADNASVRT